MNTTIPHFTCPNCAYVIKMTVTDLLQGQAYICPACGYKLSHDKDQMKTAMESMQKLRER